MSTVTSTFRKASQQIATQRCYSRMQPRVPPARPDEETQTLPDSHLAALSTRFRKLELEKGAQTLGMLIS